MTYGENAGIHQLPMEKSRKMRVGQFPPFGFVWREFGLWEALFVPFWAFSDFRRSSQEDAQGSISPLRVCMRGAWAVESFVGAVLGIFRFLDKSSVKVGICPIIFSEKFSRRAYSKIAYSVSVLFSAHFIYYIHSGFVFELIIIM